MKSARTIFLFLLILFPGIILFAQSTKDREIKISFLLGEQRIFKGTPQVLLKSKSGIVNLKFTTDSTFVLPDVKDSVEFSFDYHSFKVSTGMIAPDRLSSFNEIIVSVVYCGDNCVSHYAIIFMPGGPWIETFAPYKK